MPRLPDAIVERYRPADSNDIRSWSFGLVAAGPDAEADGWRALGYLLGSEKAFGPRRDFHCACGKYAGQQHAGVICDICGVTVVRASVRAERCAHVNLNRPTPHPVDRSAPELEVFPVLPATRFEGENGAPLLALYEQLLRANVEGEPAAVIKAVDGIIAHVGPLLEAAVRASDPQADILARGLALAPR